MKCFVIMPFGNPKVDSVHAARLESIYSKWIKVAVELISIPGAENQKLTCHRADKTFKPGEVIAHIIENLVSADIVIADLSGRNANVFYELGVRHAIGNNCILISDNLDDIPFDLRPLRTIVYEYTPDSMLLLQDSLKEAILEILQDPNTVDNPVRKFVYQRELERTNQNSKTIESELVKNIKSEMAALRNDFTEQTKTVQQLMNLVTLGHSATDTFPKSKSAFDSKSFEGIWNDTISKSCFYVREKEGELLVPYSYSGRRSLTGHLYNINLIDNAMFARFEWFHTPISGYMFLKMQANGQIEGGWWYQEDVPEEVIKNISDVSDSLPRMNRLYLKKSSNSTTFPAYVEQYFITKSMSSYLRH